MGGSSVTAAWGDVSVRLPVGLGLSAGTLPGRSTMGLVPSGIDVEGTSVGVKRQWETRPPRANIQTCRWTRGWRWQGPCGQDL